MEPFKDRKVAEFAHNLNLFDLEEILDVAIEQIPYIIEAHRISIYLLDPSEKYLLSKRHSSKRLQEHLAEKVAVDSTSTLIPQVLAKRKSLLITNVAEYIIKNNLPIKLSKRQRYTSGSCMLIPILVRLPSDYDKIIGVINFSEKADFTPFSKSDLELAGRLGEILGTSLHNCNVIEKKLGGRQKELMSELDRVKKAYAQKEINLDEAKRKQNQMLPEMPSIENYQMHVLYSPMETIGGDFYDFFQISDHEIGIVVGDVSGHGIEAALVMSMAKHILSIYSKLHRSLIETLCHANEEICASLKGNSFIAVFIGIIDTRTHILRYARAGQTYPLLFNPNREKDPVELRSQGMVLGTSRGDGYRKRIEEKTLQLLPNDVLLLYTDGVLEAPDRSGEEFSLERVMQATVDSYTHSAREITMELQKRIHDFTAGPQADDVTIMCIKVGDIDLENKEILMLDSQSEESFVVTPDLSFDEELQYQILSYEEQITELEVQRKKEKALRLELESKCAELKKELDLATSDPDSLIKQLRDQLAITLELPKDLINDNKKLHEKIDQQKREIRKLEIEVNDFAVNAEHLDNERRRLLRLVEAIAESMQAVQAELLGGKHHFDKYIQEELIAGNYEAVYQYLEGLIQIALRECDDVKTSAICKQIFTISKTYHSYLEQTMQQVIHGYE